MTDERVTELTDSQLHAMRAAVERLLIDGSSVASYHPAEILALLDEVMLARVRLRNTALEVPGPIREDVFPETVVHMHLDGKSRKYIPVDGAELKTIVTTAVSNAMVWDDAPLPEDEAIRDAFPTRSGKHDVYGEAMRLVSGRRSKGALVALVNWLLIRLEES